MKTTLVLAAAMMMVLCGCGDWGKTQPSAQNSPMQWRETSPPGPSTPTANPQPGAGPKVDASTPRPGAPMQVRKNAPKVMDLGAALVSPDEAVRAQLALPEGTGLMIAMLDENGPAAKAGLKRFDVLAKLGDQLLVNQPQLNTLTHNAKEGDELCFSVFHQGKESTVRVKMFAREVQRPIGMPGMTQRPGQGPMTGMAGMQNRTNPMPTQGQRPGMPGMQNRPQMPGWGMQNRPGMPNGQMGQNPNQRGWGQMMQQMREMLARQMQGRQGMQGPMGGTWNRPTPGQQGPMNRGWNQNRGGQQGPMNRGWNQNRGGQQGPMNRDWNQNRRGPQGPMNRGWNQNRPGPQGPMNRGWDQNRPGPQGPMNRGWDQNRPGPQGPMNRDWNQDRRGPQGPGGWEGREGPGPGGMPGPDGRPGMRGPGPMPGQPRGEQGPRVITIPEGREGEGVRIEIREGADGQPDVRVLPREGREGREGPANREGREGRPERPNREGREGHNEPPRGEGPRPGAGQVQFTQRKDGEATIQEYRDNEYTLRIRIDKDGKKTVVGRSIRDQKVVFDGSANTPEEKEKMPQPVRRRFEAIQSHGGQTTNPPARQ